MNITKCPKCKMSLIQEELDIHQCHTMISEPVRFWGDTDNDFYEVFDGMNWIPIKSEQPQGNRNKNAEDETEPNFTIVLYYALRKSRYNGIRLCCFTSSQATKRS